MARYVSNIEKCMCSFRTIQCVSCMARLETCFRKGTLASLGTSEICSELYAIDVNRRRNHIVSIYRNNNCVYSPEYTLYALALWSVLCLHMDSLSRYANVLEEFIAKYP